MVRLMEHLKSHCISIHALLAESDKRYFTYYIGRFSISIHALLAESDRMDAEY